MTHVLMASILRYTSSHLVDLYCNHYSIFNALQNRFVNSFHISILKTMQTQTVIPMLSYENGIAAMEWLSKAFGFRERMRIIDEENGRLTHGEIEAADDIIMLATPTLDYESPKKHREHCAQANKWSQVPWVIDGVLVYVGDVYAHLQNAKAAGATILTEIETDFPGPRYRAEDLEGHRWMFMQKEK